MKKTTLLFISIWVISFSAIGQHGYLIDHGSPNALHEIDLLNAQKTLIGNTLNQWDAGDFGLNGVLYAINSSDELYEIDTTNGSVTFIASIIPPTDHWWTGMAYDYTTGIMYGYSMTLTWPTIGEGSLHIIDVSNGTSTLVAMQTEVLMIRDIAIDDSGQMYGMTNHDPGELHAIDKTNGTHTLIGTIGFLPIANVGLNFCSANQTMYMFSDTSLSTVNLTTANTTFVGSLNVWPSLLAIPGSTLSINELTNNPISLYPNPAKDIINIDLPNSYINFTSEIFSITGQLVLKSKNESQLDISKLNSGMYILRISTENGLFTKRLIKE